MPRLVLFLIVIVDAALAAAPDAPDAYAPLSLYKGSWQITRQDKSQDKLINLCSRVGRYFVCEQTVNGTPGALLIFIPTGKPGHYYTQNVRPEGRATGRGDLEISGDLWVYSSVWDAGGKSVYYRTTNIFTGKNRIHFEQAESTDNKEWVVKATGDEIRLPAR